MFYQQRLHRLQNILTETPCDAILVEDKINLYYLTGLELSAGKLLVHTHGAHLFVDNRYFELCEKNSPFPVRQLDPPNFETILGNPEFSFIHTLAFDSEKTSYANFQNLTKIVGSRKLIPLTYPLKLLRAIKDASEMDTLREASALGSEGFDFLCTILKEGISEQEAAIELEIFWKKRGSKSLAFDPIIAFGPNSSMPHYRASSTKLKKGHIVLLDIGVNLNHYHSDMTRIAFFGEPDPRLLAIHEIVQKAQQAALALCRPGVNIGALDLAARNIIDSHGYGPNFTHSLGHGVGLEIHEYPMIKNTPPFNEMTLQAGMVITIEPGIYLPSIGGVRIEDTVIITEKGCENLTNRSTLPIYL